MSSIALSQKEQTNLDKLKKSIAKKSQELKLRITKINPKTRNAVKETRKQVKADSVKNGGKPVAVKKK